MSSERELDEGIKSIKSAWRREHTARANLEKMLEQAETENAKLRELSSIMLKCIMANERKALICWECPAHKEFDELRSFCCIKHDAAELGIEVRS